MISAEDYEGLLSNLGTNYFISTIQFVPELLSCVKTNNAGLSEPHQLMKLVPSDTSLTMVMQSEIPEEALNNLITGLSLRWSLKDNAADIPKQLNSTKSVFFSFLKEFALSQKDFDGHGLLEDI